MWLCFYSYDEVIMSVYSLVHESDQVIMSVVVFVLVVHPETKICRKKEIEVLKCTCLFGN